MIALEKRRCAQDEIAAELERIGGRLMMLFVTGPAPAREPFVTGPAPAAGIVAVFGNALVWKPFSWFPFGRGGIEVDSLAGLFLLITGLVSAPLFLSTGARGPTASIVLRPLLVLCVVGVVVVDNVFEFLILYELTVVAIYALICVRYEDPQAQTAAALTLTLAKLGGGAVLAGPCNGARRSGRRRRSAADFLGSA